MTRDERTQFYLANVKPRLIELGADICNASGMEDEVLHKVACDALVEFYDALKIQSYWHPWLTEAMGDFAPDNEVALNYYHLALKQARSLGESTHSICLCLANRLFEAGQREQAEAWLQRGKTEALAARDDDSIRQAIKIESEWMKPTG